MVLAKEVEDMANCSNLRVESDLFTLRCDGWCWKVEVLLSNLDLGVHGGFFFVIFIQVIIVIANDDVNVIVANGTCYGVNIG